MPRMMPLGRAFDVIELSPVIDVASAGLTGDWVSLKNASGVTFLIHKGIGTAGADPSYTFLQAKTNAGGSSKALAISTSPVHAWKKQAATDLTATTVWSTAAADVSSNVITNTDFAEQDLQLAVYFDAAELDMANGFYFVSLTVADPGAGVQWTSIQALLDIDYPNGPATVLSALG